MADRRRQRALVEIGQRIDLTRDARERAFADDLFALAGIGILGVQILLGKEGNMNSLRR